MNQLYNVLKLTALNRCHSTKTSLVVSALRNNMIVVERSSSDALLTFLKDKLPGIKSLSPVGAQTHHLMSGRCSKKSDNDGVFVSPAMKLAQKEIDLEIFEKYNKTRFLP